MNASEAAEFYAKPENQIPAGPPRRRMRPRRSAKREAVVSIRFTPSQADLIRECAERSGMSVSEFVRRAVHCATTASIDLLDLQSRNGLYSMTTSTPANIIWTTCGGSGGNLTVNSSAVAS